MMIIPNLNFGGAQNSFSKLNYELNEHVNIFSVVFNTHEEVSVPLMGELIDLEIKAGKNWLLKAYYLLKRIYKVKSLKKKLNIDTSISFLEGANYVNILSKVDERVIISIRGSKINDENIHGLLGKLRLRFLVPLLYNKSDQIVAVNESIKSEVVNDFKINSPCIVLPNFYDLNELNSKASEPISTIQEQLLNQGSFKIFSVGRLAPEKGIHYLLKVVSKLRPYCPTQLFIIGNGDYKNELIKICEELTLDYFLGNNTDHEIWYDVIFLGYNPDPVRFSKYADLIVSTSSAEGFPNAIFEMMSQGVPVIAADNDGVRELLIEDSSTYGIVLNNFNSEPIYEEWVECIKSLMENPTLLSQLGNSAKERVAMFDHKKTTKKWINLV